MIFLENPQLIVLAKISLLLVLGLGISKLIRQPRLRASFLFCVILGIPVLLVSSLYSPLLKILPQLESLGSASMVEKPLLPDRPAPQVMPDHSELTAIPKDSSLLHRNSDPVVSPSEVSLSKGLAIDHPSKAGLSDVPVATASIKINWYTVTTWIYLAGMSMIFVLYLGSYMKLLTIKTHRAIGLPVRVWKSILSDQKHEPSLVMTNLKVKPMIYGLTKAKVLLPDDSQNWTEGKLRSTLIHEAAHLEHRDVLTRFVSSLCRIALWFHPLVWIAHKELIAAQEESCDQSVLAAGVYPEDYAEELLSNVYREAKDYKQALAMAKWSQLGKRVNLVLNMKDSDRIHTNIKKMKRSITGTTLVAIGVLSCIGFAKNNLSIVEKEITQPLENTNEVKESATINIVKDTMFAFVDMERMLEVHSLAKGFSLDQKNTAQFNLLIDEIKMQIKDYAKENKIQVVLNYTGKNTYGVAMPVTYDPTKDITETLLKKY